MKKLMALLLCAALLTVLLPVLAENTETFKSGDFEYVLLEDGTARIKKYIGEAETLDIPADLDGHAVSSIGNYAFENCFSLISVTIPEGVTEIGSAFVTCPHLASVSIPDSAVEIGGNPFYGCNFLTAIGVSADHPALETIDGVLFSKADHRLISYPSGLSLNTYEVPEGTVRIGKYAFSTCMYLTKITIPDSVADIGKPAFETCFGLTSISVSPGNPVLESMDGVLFSREDHRLICCPEAYAAETYDIPEGTEMIDDYAFRFCNFTGVTIPGSVKSIGNNAFRSCKNLTAITIPGSVSSIGNRAFYGCESLAGVTVPGSVTEIGNKAFGSCDSLTLTVPGNSFAEQYCKDNGLNYVLAEN